MSKNTVQSVTVECPDCAEKFVMKGEIWLGKKISCPHCTAELEVVETTPVELDWAYDDEYEDEDEDTDDEDW